MLYMVVVGVMLQYTKATGKMINSMALVVLFIGEVSGKVHLFKVK